MSINIVFVSNTGISLEERQQTSIAIANLATHFEAEAGYNLFLDLTSDGQTSQQLALPSAKPVPPIANALMLGVKLEDLIHPSIVTNLDLVSGGPLNSPRLSPLRTHPASHRLLGDAIKPIEEYYRYILIDCPNYLSVLTVNALTVADAFVFMLSGNASEATISRMKHNISRIRQHLNSSAPVLGVIGALQGTDAPYMMERFDLLLKHFGGKTLLLPFSDAEQIDPAGDGQPPIGELLDVYKHIAGELADRLERYRTIREKLYAKK